MGWCWCGDHDTTHHRYHHHHGSTHITKKDGGNGGVVVEDNEGVAAVVRCRYHLQLATTMNTNNDHTNNLRAPCHLLSWTLLIMTIMMLLALTTLPVCEAVWPPPSLVRIAVLSPYTDVSNVRIQTGVKLALQDILNNSTLFANTTVELVMNDTATPEIAARSAVWNVQRGVDVMVGGLLGQGTVPLSNVGAGAQVPVVSYGVATVEFSNAIVHPYFSRTIVSDTTTGEAFLAIMQRNGWKRAVILHTTNTYGRGLSDYLVNRAPSGYSILPYGFPSKQETGASIDTIRAAIERAMRQMREVGTYIFMLHALPNDVVDVLPMLYNTDLWAPPYQWFGTLWVQYCTPAVARNNGFDQSKFVGVIGLAPFFNATLPAVKSYMDRTAFNLSAGYTIREFTPYDTMWVVAKGFARMWANQSLANNGQNLRDSIRQVVHNGLSGRIQFSGVNGDIYGSQYIYNGDANGVFHTIGTWVANRTRIGGDLIFTDDFLYLGGRRDIPRDSPGYVDGQSLSMVTQGDSLVLSFGIGVLGAWTCLIIIEQALAYQRKGSSVVANDTCGRYRAYQWLALSSIALGSCAIWGLTMIGASSTGVGSLSLLFDPFTSIMALIYAMVLCSITLYLQLWSSNRVRSATITPVLASTPPRSSSDGNSRGHGNGHVRIQTMRVTPRDVCEHAMKVMTPLSVVAGFFYAGAIWGAHQIIYSGVHVAASNTRSGDIEIAAFIFAWVVSIPPLVAFFHAERQLWRITAAFTLALATFGCQMIHLQSLSWIYQSSAGPPYSHELWSDLTIHLLVSIMAAVLCFLFIGINVSSLKLSRNILDRLLGQMQQQMNKLEGHLAVEKKLVRAASLDADESRRMLELINYCRPHVRNHAIAISMASKAETSANASRAYSVSRPQAPIPPPVASGAMVTAHDRASSRNGRLSAATGGANNSAISAIHSSLNNNNGGVAAWTAAAVTPVAVPKSDRDILTLLNELNGPVQLESGPVAERAIRDVTLPQILSHPVTLEIFKDSLQRQHYSDESICFVLDIHRYRLIDSSITRSVIAQELYAIYLAPRSSDINVPNAMRDKMTKAVKQGDSRMDLFDEIEAELMRQLNLTVMDHFVSTPQFKLCCLILNHPSYRLQRRQLPEGDPGLAYAGGLQSMLSAPMGSISDAHEGNGGNGTGGNGLWSDELQPQQPPQQKTAMQALAAAQQAAASAAAAQGHSINPLGSGMNGNAGSLASPHYYQRTGLGHGGHGHGHTGAGGHHITTGGGGGGTNNSSITGGHSGPATSSPMLAMAMGGVSPAPAMTTTATATTTTDFVLAGFPQSHHTTDSGHTSASPLLASSLALLPPPPSTGITTSPHGPSNHPRLANGHGHGHVGHGNLIVTIPSSANTTAASSPANNPTNIMTATNGNTSFAPSSHAYVSSSAINLTVPPNAAPSSSSIPPVTPSALGLGFATAAPTPMNIGLGLAPPPQPSSSIRQSSAADRVAAATMDASRLGAAYHVTSILRPHASSEDDTSPPSANRSLLEHLHGVNGNSEHKTKVNGHITKACSVAAAPTTATTATGATAGECAPMATISPFVAPSKGGMSPADVVSNGGESGGSSGNNSGVDASAPSTPLLSNMVSSNGLGDQSLLLPAIKGGLGGTAMSSDHTPIANSLLRFDPSDNTNHSGPQSPNT